MTDAIRYTLNGSGGVTAHMKSSEYDDPYAALIAEVGELPEWTDFRTVEQYQVYYDAGLNTLFIQENDAYNGPNAEGLAKLKETMAKAMQAGIDKVIISDRRLADASRLAHSILDAPSGDVELLKYKQFFNVWNDTVNRAHTVQEVKDAVKAILKEYIAVENFYGVMLGDEPNYQQIAAYGEIYGYIQEVFPIAKQELEGQGEKVNAEDIYIQACLLPSGFTNIDKTDFVSAERFSELVTACGGDKYKAHQAAYSEYIEIFFAKSNAKRIMSDIYAISHDRNSATIGSSSPYAVSRYHFSSLIELAEQAKENGAELGGIILSTQIDSWNGNAYRPKPNEDFMYYQINSFMMFGAKSLGYHTYWAKTGADANLHPDGTSFIGRDGEPTELYPTFQKLNAETLSLARFMNDYSYNSYKYYTNGTVSNYLEMVSGGQATAFNKISVSVDSGKEVVVTEHVNKTESGKYAYAIFNSEVVSFPDDNVDAGHPVTVTLNVSDTNDMIKVFYDGQISEKPVINGSVTLTISAGHAYYVIVD